MPKKLLKQIPKSQRPKEYKVRFYTPKGIKVRSFKTEKEASREVWKANDKGYTAHKLYPFQYMRRR